MTKDILLAQILAQIPDCPNYQASGYLLEFVDRLRTDGQQKIVPITNFGNDGYSAYLPDEVMSVQKVYANGLSMGTDLTEDEAVWLMYQHPATSTITDDMLLDEDGKMIVDEYEYPILSDLFSGREGSGTVEDPYLIATADQLNDIRNDLSASYKQIANIDLATYGASYNGGKGWIAIGIDSPFTGNYDGDNYTITGLYVNDFHRTTGAKAGLFYNVGLEANVPSIIKNIKITGASLVGTVAGTLICGDCINYVIQNCHVRSTTLEGNGNTSGLVKSLYYSEIDNCSVDVTAVCHSCGFGGICNDADACTIHDSWADVAVTPNDEHQMPEGGTPVSGFYEADSYCGLAVSLTATNVENCYTLGSIKGSLWVSGLIQTLNMDLDGITGSNVVNCYAAVKLETFVNDYEPSLDPLFGALISEINGDCVVQSSYFDSTVALETQTAAGIATTTTNMKKEATFIGWNFVGIWTIAEGVSYPTLRTNT